MTFLEVGDWVWQTKWDGRGCPFILAFSGGRRNRHRTSLVLRLCVGQSSGGFSGGTAEEYAVCFSLCIPRLGVKVRVCRQAPTPQIRSCGSIRSHWLRVSEQHYASLHAMTFSPDEVRMIERLRKGEGRFSRWRRWRWFLAVFCACMAVVSVVALVILIRFADGLAGVNPIEYRLVGVTLVAYLLPPINMLLMLWLFFLGSVICRWHGDSKARLLLRLIDELQKRDN